MAKVRRSKTANESAATDAIDVAYRDITEQFARKYEASYQAMCDKVYTVRRNLEAADYLSLVGLAAEAKRLRSCGLRLVGNDPNNLQQERYCRQTAWCIHCANVLARKRSEQVSEACRLFSAGCRRSECTVHNLIIRPETTGGFDSNLEDLQAGMDLLRDFGTTLRRHHSNHDLAYFRKFKINSKGEKAARKKLWGPTISSIHIVPPPAMKIPGTPANVHMHLAIVTPREGSKTFVTKTVSDLWEKTRQNSMYRYVSRDAEVIRETIRRKRRKYRHWSEKDKSEDSEEREGRLGHFWPGVPEDQSTVKAGKTFSYLARSFKAHWEPQSLYEANDLLEDLGIKPQQLYQRLGMLGVLQGAVPDRFPAGKLDHRFIAEYTIGGTWQVLLRRDA